MGLEKRTWAWIAFLAPIAIVALWFSWSACVELYHYIVLSAHTPAQGIEWSVVELSDERYVLRGSYVYQVEGTSYSGATTLKHPPYRNAWAASKAIPEYASQPWQIWYSPTNPTHSSLQKSFPFKECISSVIIWGILLYFIGLKLYCSQNLFTRKR